MEKACTNNQKIHSIEEFLKELSVRTGEGQPIPFRVCEPEEGKAEILMEYAAEEDAGQVTLHLQWRFPKCDIAGMWHSDVGKDRSLKADFSDALRSMTTISAPVICMFSDNERNRFTFAFSEVNRPLEFSCFLHEEDSTFVPGVQLTLHHLKKHARYAFLLLVNVQDIPYDQAIKEASIWWESLLEDKPMEVPDVAREPVYSTWYSYHQGVSAADIEQECQIASELGCKTVIVDDGWQCNDENRDYAFCGNWSFSEEKFPHVREHVAKIHQLGMKYMIWISVPFLGYKSDNWDRFQDMILSHRPSLRTAVLDIRYPEVREFLVDTYVTLAREYDLDGFKLDFVDEFYASEDSPKPNLKMDYSCVQAALNRLMLDLREKLLAFKSDFLIEFRQKYIGPGMRTYGNMFRVSDCPGAKDTNRVGITDLRLLSGNTAVHSDMLLWHPDDTANQAALNILNCLFATVQLSVPLLGIPNEHLEMVRFWMSFMKAHRHTLLESEFHPHGPQYLYPVIEAISEKERILAVYQTNQVVTITASGNQENVYIVNATASDSLILRVSKRSDGDFPLPATEEAEICCYDCCGRMIWKKNGKIEPMGLYEYHVPSAGFLEISQ